MRPNQAIESSASDVHKLVIQNGEMFRIENDENNQVKYTKVESVSLAEGIQKFYIFLYDFGKK